MAQLPINKLSWFLSPFSFSLSFLTSSFHPTSFTKSKIRRSRCDDYPFFAYLLLMQLISKMHHRIHKFSVVCGRTSTIIHSTTLVTHFNHFFLLFSYSKSKLTTYWLAPPCKKKTISFDSLRQFWTMFSFHKPKVYRSTQGCCICKAKSSR